MRYLRYISVLAVSLAISSCFMIAPTGNPPHNYALLPGECLLSNELEYVTFEDVNIVRNGCYTLALKLDAADCHWEKYHPDKNLGGSYYLMPPNDIFTQFGKNKSKVKKAYEKLYHNFTESFRSLNYSPHGYEIMTVLYDDIKLIADKPFAGIPAGENLAHLIITDDAKRGYHLISSIYNRYDKAGTLLGIPLEYESLIESEYVSILIPVEDHEVIPTRITFEIEIPAKKVNLLNWLNAQIDDPDAPVPYEEITLHGKFVAGYRLQ